MSRFWTSPGQIRDFTGISFEGQIISSNLSNFDIEVISEGETVSSTECTSTSLCSREYTVVFLPSFTDVTFSNSSIVIDVNTTCLNRFHNPIDFSPTILDSEILDFTILNRYYIDITSSVQKLVVVVCNDQNACSESNVIEINVQAIGTDSNTDELTDAYTQDVLALVNAGLPMLAANLLFSIVTSPSPESFMEESVTLLEIITNSILEYKPAEDLTVEEANIILSILAVVSLTDENAEQAYSLLSDVSVAHSYDIQLTGSVLDEIVSLQSEGDGGGDSDSDDGLSLDDYLTISDNMEIAFTSKLSNCGKALVVEGETFSYLVVTRSVEQLSDTQTILPIPGTDSFAILPPDFGDYLREWANENLEESQDLFCFTIH